ncbi:MAG: PilZ domain-containing protein [Deltaproteobacteria bacterium]|nr:PilZ domain-containing protein [Deltaproteobacteria bacterium]
MSEIISTARTARENLAKGLNALQADPNVSANYLQAAEPIAMAMGALHRIEKSGGGELAAAAPQALDAVRQALGILQTQAATDPRLNAVLEMIAGSLGMVFSLTKAAKYGPPPQPAAAAPAAQPYAPPAAPVVAAQPAPYAPPPVAQPAQFAPQAAPQPYAPPPAPAFAQPAPQPYVPPQQPYAPPQQQQPAAQPYAPPQPAPFAAPQQPAHQAPPWSPSTMASPQHPVQPAQQPPPQVIQQPVSRGAAPIASQRPPTPDEIKNEKVPTVEAELGTHSVSNFYKGLSGNDVVDFGGIFISTYNIPQIGQTLKVHVTLPGGYEFEAIGVVRWTREARESMASDISPPGFGLQFTKISPEARNLVYRYVRNREPIFHDDL